ncbi:questin oxidase family protein [Streptomyces sp. VRA16 Mangrove soil]|uniref:questin oxidase family protein n=1 Tax=Streptomyces sp. VRA16 Mangrove soil TaxID=2817434 RepID=UPI001A9F4B05|nr:questin oxidase family protein [Streptomyces sp. VRA16 Mangrove soil]MBO1337191.1 questin oxidase family protein [Streptomyces sp. VRA16 Mangrove soil]
MTTDTGTTTDPSGTLDEALERLHTSGPERLGRLTNHAPMAVEALASRGQGASVHRWLDLYTPKLEEFPAPVEPITDENRRAALGDPRRAADWIAYFTRQVEERPWRDVLAEWWPRLLPGMYGGSTHPVIRVGHAVRTLLSAEPTAPRLTELAHGLGYWAARHHPVTGVTALPDPGDDPAAALDAVEPIADRGSGGFPARLARVSALPVWAPSVTDPDEARLRLTGLVRAAVHRYATHGHGEETMLVHAATAPNAVLRTLPALPRALWVPSLGAAWTASAAVTAMYAPDEPVAYEAPGTFAAGEVVERALAHGDEHVIKFTDTALDVGDERALGSALRCVEISAPLV